MAERTSNSIEYCNDVIFTLDTEENIFYDFNKALISGKIVSQPSLTCTGYYTTIIKNRDKKVRIMLPKELLEMYEDIELIHKFVMVAGEIRSNGGGLFTIWASYFRLYDVNQKNLNCIFLKGKISKPIEFSEEKIKTNIRVEKVQISKMFLKLEGAENELLCEARKNKDKYVRKKLSKGMRVELIGELCKYNTDEYYVFITKIRKEVK